jgi:hypothetical protein
LFDQRSFIERVERANTAEFARLLTSPTYEQEQALRDHFGDPCYQRLNAPALLGAVPKAERGLSDCRTGSVDPIAPPLNSWERRKPGHNEYRQLS